MERYGLPYKGSKNKIAKFVVAKLPSADVFVDLFAGGCAVTHCAMLSNKYKRFICNDINNTPMIFRRAINGEFRGFSYVPTREEFFESDDPVIKLIYSFGNDRETYLWSREIEPVKVCASRMISANSQYERRMWYRKFMDNLEEYISKYGEVVDAGHTKQLQSLERLESLQSLQSLERLQSLQSLERLESLQSLEILQQDYKTVEIPPNSLVYCDPPYRDTSGYNGTTFDFVAFDKWLADVDFMVVVSEYTAPNDCVEVASIDKRSLLCATGRRTVKQEKLFVQSRFLDEYKKRMDKEGQQTLWKEEL